MEEVGKCVRGRGSVEECMGLVWRVQGSVLGCGDKWKRVGGGVEKRGVPTLLHTSPNSSSQPLYPSSNTSPYSPILTLSSTPYQNFSLFSFIAKLV